MSQKTHNDKAQQQRIAAADSPHFQQDGIASAVPPPMHLTAEPVELKKDEEDKALLKKKNTSFADDGTPETPNDAGNTNGNGGNKGNFLVSLQRKIKQELVQRKEKIPAETPKENILTTLQRKHTEEKKETAQQKKNNKIGFADDGTPSPPSSPSNGSGNRNEHILTTLQRKYNAYHKPAKPIAPFQLKYDKSAIPQPRQFQKYDPFRATPVQKKAQDTNSDAQAEPSTKGTGNSLPSEVQGKMENTMGQDFSNVNIHKDSKQATDAGALAYAQGNDVHFAPGQFKPETQQGQELIGHELAHVKQQREGRVQPTKMLGKGMAVNDDPALEKEADDLGRKAAKGEGSSSPSNGNQPAGKILQGKGIAQMKLDAGGSGSGVGGPISVDGSQSVVKGLASSQPVAFMDGVKAAPLKLNESLNAENKSLKDSFPAIEQPTGLENRPSEQKNEADAPLENASPEVAQTENLQVAEQSVAPPAQSQETVASPQAPTTEAAPNRPSNTKASIGDHSVNYSAGTSPKVDKSGNADPAKMQTDLNKEATSLATKQASADTEATKDFKENDIYPAVDELEELKPNVEVAAPPVLEVPEWEELPKADATIAAAFDKDAKTTMDEQVSVEMAKNDAEVAKVEAESQQEWTKYETDLETEKTRVLGEQQKAQGEAKTAVDLQRENWKRENQAVKGQFDTESERQKKTMESQITAEVAKADAEVTTAFSNAENDAAEKARLAEANARAKEAEAESGGIGDAIIGFFTSVWDWLKDQFNAIVDTLKDAVNALIDAAKKLANGIIEFARKAIVGFITVFGNVLKGLVDIALAAFPEIRDRIKGLIDTAVNTAVETVNALADGLKDFVNKLLDALGAVLNAIISAYQAFINLLFDALKFIAVGLRKILKGLYNLVLSAWDSPNQFMGQLQEEFLGMNLSDPLPFERTEHPPSSYFRPPSEGATGMTEIPKILQKDSLSEGDIEAVSIQEAFSPDLMADLMNNVPENGEMEFGGSEVDELDALREAYGIGVEDAVPAELQEGDMAAENTYPYADLAEDPAARADAELDDFLANQAAPTGGESASGGTAADNSSVPEEAKIGPFTVGQRFRYLRTQMWNGITGWWANNSTKIILGLVAVVAAGVAAIILSGGAVLSLIPPILQILGTIFLGAALVKAGSYLKDFLTKAWSGGAGIAAGAKDFARALVIMVVELIFILLFDLNTILKAAKAGLKGSLKMAAQGAKNTTKAFLGAGKATLVNSGKNLGRLGRGLVNIGKGGAKLTTKGLKIGFSKGVKTVQSLIARVKAKLAFKKFRIRRAGRWFKLEGKLNPWVLLATGEIREVDSVAGKTVGQSGKFTAKGGDEVVDGILIGATKAPSNFVKALKSNPELKDQLLGVLKEVGEINPRELVKGLSQVGPKQLEDVLAAIKGLKGIDGIEKVVQDLSKGGGNFTLGATFALKFLGKNPNIAELVTKFEEVVKVSDNMIREMDVSLKGKNGFIELKNWATFRPKSFLQQMVKDIKLNGQVKWVFSNGMGSQDDVVKKVTALLDDPVKMGKYLSKEEIRAMEAARQQILEAISVADFHISFK